MKTARNRHSIRIMGIFAVWAILFSLSACSSNEIFSEFYSFPDAQWDAKDTVRFEVPVSDLFNAYAIYLTVRNNNQYPFRNLWLFAELQKPDGTLRLDTFSVKLADVYGKWYGNGVSLYSLSILYEKPVQYPDTGVYVYRFRQGMRARVLEGVSDLGLRVETVD
ncbi:MAG: Gliding motility lipoprotein GldH [Candidatus Ordinivivax streblomastigis]|uniref:Gliding motility lipoprotein GldH n=1 Tax=Candidatus Ordinivivax streblomastigis TaxID=2540710 RepID=A0A5M8P2J0_9BACT|nr:MAG: Gliding motility lipoprotein GldH [Candidatus Ordinivivax streblomastigis]